jgi:hypothetical protein
MKNYPAKNYYSLNKFRIPDIEYYLDEIQKNLHKGTNKSILNAFKEHTIIAKDGSLYIEIKGLSRILRLGSSGAEKHLVYNNPLSNTFPYLNKVNNKEHVNDSFLLLLLNERKKRTNGKTKKYLEVSENILHNLPNLPEIKEQKEIYLEEFEASRKKLKSERIEKYNIEYCEFSGQQIVDYSEVEFAHIDSVATHPEPEKSLNIDNGVIILKQIHKELTKNKFLVFEEMYQFCKDNNYSTKWADNL